jgi:hypothetical protein
MWGLEWRSVESVIPAEGRRPFTVTEVMGAARQAA